MEKGNVLISKLIATLIALGILAIPISIPERVVAKDDYLTYDQLKAYEEKRQEEQWSRDLFSYAETLVGKKTGQCVLALRHRFGVPKSQSQGAAASIKTNSLEGKVGHLILFRYNHVGITLKDTGDGWYFFHSNKENYPAWNQNGKGRIEWISKKDKSIRGYKIISYK